MSQGQPGQPGQPGQAAQPPNYMNLGLKKIAATKTLFKKCLNYTAETFCQQCQPECRTSDSG